MKRLLFLFSLVAASCLLWSNCGSSNSTTTVSSTTGIKHRAFVSQDVTAGSVFAGLRVINVDTDVMPSQITIAPSTTFWAPKFMVLTPNRAHTVISSSLGTAFPPNALYVVNNVNETAGPPISLPGPSDSVVVSPDSSAAYAAVPTAPEQIGSSLGAVEVVSLAAEAVIAEVDIPSVRHLAIGNTGNRVLGFSDSSNQIAVITPSNIGTGNPVVTLVGGFDRPFFAYFSTDDSTAYVVNCGGGCIGGTQASVQKLDLTTNTPGAPVAVPAADGVFVNGTTMYVAGTPVPAVSCTIQGASANCGQLTTFDLTNMQVVGSPVLVTDGTHSRIALGANGQLFVGARTCTAPACLSIYNLATGAVVFPAAPGDVTGIQAISTRPVVYVVQGGELVIYDAATGQPQEKQIDISGDATDVVTVDN